MRSELPYTPTHLPNLAKPSRNLVLISFSTNSPPHLPQHPNHRVGRCLRLSDVRGFRNYNKIKNLHYDDNRTRRLMTSKHTQACETARLEHGRIERVREGEGDVVRGSRSESAQLGWERQPRARRWREEGKKKKGAGRTRRERPHTRARRREGRAVASTCAAASRQTRPPR